MRLNEWISTFCRKFRAFPNESAGSHFQLSQAARKQLGRGGWHAGRRVDIRAIVAFLNQQGIEPSPAAREFLEEFHGLRFELPQGGLSFVNFDVRETMAFLDEGDLARLEELTAQTLCPIGLGGRFLLFIAPAGEVTFLHDEWLMNIRARDLPDALETIFFPKFDRITSVYLRDDQKPG